MEKEVSLSQVTNIQKYSSRFSNLGTDYMFLRMTSGTEVREVMEAMRINGMMLLLCFKGEIEMEVNLVTCRLKENSVIVVGSDTLFHVKKVDWENLDAYLFLISPGFLRDINFDLNIINTVGYSHPASPSMELNDDEMHLMKSYLDVIHYNTVNNDALYARSISRCLIAAAVYQLLQLVRKHRVLADTPSNAKSRRTNYVKDFLALVHQHFRKERSIQFYASKLYISPKYLSIIVKETTRRSAAEWIDEFVILEAKNLLRFSGKNVQQIAYELNFNNQSSFGKYFKHLTGMSPTQFQRS